MVTDNVTLKKDWQRLRLVLTVRLFVGCYLSIWNSIVADSPQKQVFYIKGITLDDRPAQNPLPTEVDFLNSTSINSTNTLASASVNSSNILTSQINANGTNSPAPATIKFGANASGGLLPYSYSWNFGDGANGHGIGEKVLHSFNKSGHYTITLAC